MCMIHNYKLGLVMSVTVYNYYLFRSENLEMP